MSKVRPVDDMLEHPQRINVSPKQLKSPKRWRFYSGRAFKILLFVSTLVIVEFHIHKFTSTQLSLILDNAIRFDFEYTTTPRAGQLAQLHMQPKTGSFSNCSSTPDSNSNDETDMPYISLEQKPFPLYTGVLKVSCHSVRYRVSKKLEEKNIIIVGVLSKNSMEGKFRRESIRNTWAKNQSGVLFLLAGPWDKVESEFEKFDDILWIDQEELYNGEESVLTLKSFTFIGVIDILSSVMNLDYTHIFKTDDDSYVDLNALQIELSQNKDYVGHCQLKHTKVVRGESYKWSLSNQTYPEEYFPKYCQGAGYGLSRNFVNCAYSKHHIRNVRFMPLEDVAVGILAERCGFEPSLTAKGEIKVTRYDSKEARNRTRTDNEKSESFVPITACMTGRIVQHRVIDDYDMEELHKTVQDPLYCKKTRRERGKKIKELEAKGVEWFG